MSSETYRICVSANGLTSNYSLEAKDLLDATIKVRELQEKGVASITMTLVSLGYERQLAEYTKAFGLTPPPKAFGLTPTP